MLFLPVFEVVSQGSGDVQRDIPPDIQRNFTRDTVSSIADHSVALVSASSTHLNKVASDSLSLRDAEYSPWTKGSCMWGLSYGAPFKIALGWAGGMLHEDSEGGSDTCLFGAGKIGVGGVRVSSGVAKSIGALGGGAALSAGFLRTFGAPLNAIPSTNYVGASLHIFPLLGLGGEIGWYTPVDKGVDGESRGAMITWSAGIGF